MTSDESPRVDDLWGDGDVEWLICSVLRNGRLLIRCRASSVEGRAVGDTRVVPATFITKNCIRVSTAESRGVPVSKPADGGRNV